MKNPKRIVLIGGGTGIYTLLSGLKKHDCILTSIVSMMDSGGSTGRLIDEFGTLPVGDIRRSTIANLVVENISNAIHESKAKKIYVCNLMTKKGETNNFTITQHLNELIKYLGKDCLDYVIYNSQMPSQERLDKYKGEESQTVKIDSENFKKFKAKFIGENLISEASLVRHNEEIIAKLILSLE